MIGLFDRLLGCNLPAGTRQQQGCACLIKKKQGGVDGVRGAAVVGVESEGAGGAGVGLTTWSECLEAYLRVLIV
jgi:hypothetical protein